MTPGLVLDEAGFGRTLTTAEHTLFRLELQPGFNEECEARLLAAFLRGDPFPATEVPGLAAWYGQVARQVHDMGIRVERVRVQNDPPTDYQRFERWLDRWNIPAGEIMRYLTRQRAHAIGLLPAAGELARDPGEAADTEWWLIDSAKLLVMHFDGEGHRIRNELITDPAMVVKACAWRDLAVHHSVLAQLSDVAA